MEKLTNKLAMIFVTLLTILAGTGVSYLIIWMMVQIGKLL